MMSRFSYLLDKIKQSTILNEPFTHLEINDFLSEDDFLEVISANEIDLQQKFDDEKLFDKLFACGYKMVPFPGAITDHLEYIKNRKKGKKIGQHSACESAGVVLRLLEPKTSILRELKEFISSYEFNKVLAEKFTISLDECSMDSGIQKYLDGYEISPHPDLRKKALTYMLNINTSPDSEDDDHHTHYMKFTDEYNYVKEYWKGNPKVERCWVPWSWCKTQKQQKKNNSIVVFAPSNDTIHAVKASYEHFRHQRTQVYGNLWYLDREHTGYSRATKKVEWYEIDLNESHENTRVTGVKKRILSKFQLLKRKNENNKMVDRSRKSNY